MGRRPILATLALAALGAAAPAAADDDGLESTRRFVGLHCAGCHDAAEHAGGLDLESIAGDDPARHAEAWEKVVRRLDARQMPPPESPRPRNAEVDRASAWIAGELDRDAAEHPRPGRVATFRRLNRAEYRNAVRDLLDLEVDAAALLPADESSHGFDNLTVGDLSPTYLDRALDAAGKLARLAVGNPGRSPGGETYRVPPDRTQEEHVEGLPVGTRGGLVVRHAFPLDGTYEIQLRLARDRNEHVEGLREPAEVEILVDDRPAACFRVEPPRSDRDHQGADAHLKARVEVAAGPHRLGAAFVRDSSSLIETKRQPYQAHYNMHRHPRLTPALYQVSVAGPFDGRKPAATPSRLRIFGPGFAPPEDAEGAEGAARAILGRLARRAYRRPAGGADLDPLLDFYREAREGGGDFDAGIESALAAILVSPHFLFRIERDPPGAAPGSAYPVDGPAIASRLSFFLWSGPPDDALLEAAGRGDLATAEGVEAQARRMLADPRSASLVDQFADQWLHLRNLDSITPDLRLFPDFDDNLRRSARREAELHFEEVVRDDRSVLDLIRPDHTFLDERLARHYGVPNILGSQFRRVPAAEAGGRGGLFRQAALLTVTSYATRTSPTVRGKWVLENVLGTPPQPPPPDIPALGDGVASAHLSVRERLAEHRRDEACAGCHRSIDPPGFALERFDAVGRWRDAEGGRPVDAAGGLPDGSTFEGVDGLEAAILRRPELFVSALAEKLMTFGLGRVVDHRDAPAIRAVVRRARGSDYRFSSLILGIVSSPPFRSRSAE